MVTFIWSLWEIRGPSCFMENRVFLVIRLISGVVFQFWCSFITFPLYVIITQMGSRFKKSVVPESTRESLQGWHKRAKKFKRDHQKSLLVFQHPLLWIPRCMDTNYGPSSSIPNSSFRLKNISSFNQPAFLTQGEIYERSPPAEK